ncbi:MAG TPA: hypothetical protein VF212_17435 [Longimicrobiales bacterium]
MSYARHLAGAVVAGTLIVAGATPAWAQVCMGIPADDGEISLQGEVVSDGTVNAYGGRIGMNFNTEYAFDFSLRRPQEDAGLGLVLTGSIGYEMLEYEPPVCFTIGVRHERHPVTGGEDATETLIPIGFGIGKRLGSAKRLSLAIFVRPEYLVRIRPDPAEEADSFWDDLGRRSEGRGVIGLLASTPFLYGTGSIEISTRDYRPELALGLGVTF